eukprot:2828790-Pleurochrysis_carterae.AAC.2
MREYSYLGIPNSFNDQMILISDHQGLDTLTAVRILVPTTSIESASDQQNGYHSSTFIVEGSEVAVAMLEVAMSFLRSQLPRATHLRRQGSAQLRRQRHTERRTAHARSGMSSPSSARDLASAELCPYLVG